MSERDELIQGRVQILHGFEGSVRSLDTVPRMVENLWRILRREGE